MKSEINMNITNKVYEHQKTAQQPTLQTGISAQLNLQTKL